MAFSKLQNKFFHSGLKDKQPRIAQSSSPMKLEKQAENELKVKPMRFPKLKLKLGKQF